MITLNPNASPGETQLLPGLVSGAGDREVAKTVIPTSQRGRKGRDAEVSPAGECQG